MNYKNIFLISLVLFNISNNFANNFANNFTNYFYNLNKTYKINIENMGLQYPHEFQVINLLM